MTKRLGAEQIIILGRHADRIALARQFGATDIVRERGAEAIERVKELTGGYGVHSVLEWVGLDQARGDPRCGALLLQQRHDRRRSRPPSAPTSTNCYRARSTAGIDPGRVFDRVIGLDEVPDGSRATNDRESIKVMVQP